jgi:hypothetical protein
MLRIGHVERVEGTDDGDADAVCLRLVVHLKPGASKRRAAVDADRLRATVTFGVDVETGGIPVDAD